MGVRKAPTRVPSKGSAGYRKITKTTPHSSRGTTGGYRMEDAKTRRKVEKPGGRLLRGRGTLRVLQPKLSTDALKTNTSAGK